MIEVIPLRQRDVSSLSYLFNQTTATLPYHWDIDSRAFLDNTLFHSGEPGSTLHSDPNGWLVAHQGDQTLGFVHCAIGKLSSDDPLTERGFIRSLMTLPQAPQRVAGVLLQAAIAYFRKHHIDHITAFASDTGYPCLLAGRGFIPGDRIDLLAAMGESGFAIQERWLMYEKSLSSYLTEQLPAMAGLSLRIQADNDRRTFHVAHRSEYVASMTVEYLRELSAHSRLSAASLRQLKVEAPFRRQGIGTWLMLRTINALVSDNQQRLIVHLNHQDAPAQSLLIKLAFTELPVRGYTYTLTLSP